MTETPPEEMIALAEQAARKSPCVKSKRGVVVWDPVTNVATTGFNGPPEPFMCNGDDACRSVCPKKCLHAETRALSRSVKTSSSQMLHIKISAAGKGVPGGGPSCWQCSREVLDSGIAGIWLYEKLPHESHFGRWRFYSSIDFHVATLKHCAALKDNALWTADDELRLINFNKDNQ